MYPETFKGIINAIGGMTVLGIVHLILGEPLRCLPGGSPLSGNNRRDDW